MEFLTLGDLRTGLKFIDAREIRYAGVRTVFIKVDPANFSLKIDTSKDGIGINLTTGAPTLFSLTEHPIIELQI